MEEVAARADLSKGTIYIYFRNKDELFVELARRGIQDLRKYLDEVVADPHSVSGREELAYILRGYARFGIESPSRYRMIVSWINATAPISAPEDAVLSYRADVVQLFARVQAVIDRGKTDGSIRADLPTPELALQLWAAVNGVLMAAARPEELEWRIQAPVDTSVLVGTVLSVLLAGVAP